MHNRLSTTDRMVHWNMALPAQCVLCNNSAETRNHLFFSCEFSAWIWSNLTKGISLTHHSTSWNEIVRALFGSQMDFKSRLCIRYAMQAAIHMIWYERNNRLHEEAPRDLLYSQDHQTEPDQSPCLAAVSEQNHNFPASSSGFFPHNDLSSSLIEEDH